MKLPVMMPFLTPTIRKANLPYFLHLRFGTILPLLEFEGPVYWWPQGTLCCTNSSISPTSWCTEAFPPALLQTFFWWVTKFWNHLTLACAHSSIGLLLWENLLSRNMGYARTLLEPMFTFEPTHAQLSHVSTEFSALHNNAKTTAQHSFLATILTTQVHVIFYSSLGPNPRFQKIQSNQVSSHSYIFFLAAVGLSENKMCYNLLLCPDNYWGRCIHYYQNKPHHSSSSLRIFDSSPLWCYNQF